MSQKNSQSFSHYQFLYITLLMVIGLLLAACVPGRIPPADWERPAPVAREGTTQYWFGWGGDYTKTTPNMHQGIETSQEMSGDYMLPSQDDLDDILLTAIDLGASLNSKSHLSHALNDNREMIEETGIEWVTVPTLWEACLVWHKDVTLLDNVENTRLNSIEPVDVIVSGNSFTSRSDASNIDPAAIVEAFNIMGELYRVVGPNNMAEIQQLEENKIYNYINKKEACDIVFKNIKWLPVLINPSGSVEPKIYPVHQFDFDSMEEADEFVPSDGCGLTDA